MEVLGDWLRPLTEATLCKCLDRDLPEGREYLRYARQGPPTVEGDGNLLRLERRDTRCLQVTEWRTSSPPYWVTISDSYTRVAACFSADATRDYEFPAQQATGTVITVHAFDVVIDRSARPEEAITLQIKDFEVEGCEGASEYGDPVDVSYIDSVRDLLDELMVNPEDEMEEQEEIPDERVLGMLKHSIIPWDQQAVFRRPEAWDQPSLDSPVPLPSALLESWNGLAKDWQSKNGQHLSLRTVEDSMTYEDSMPYAIPRPESDAGLSPLSWPESNSESESSRSGSSREDSEGSDGSDMETMSPSPRDMLPPDSPMN